MRNRVCSTNWTFLPREKKNKAEELGLGRSVTPCGSGSNHSFPNGCLMPKADDRRKMLEKCLPRSCMCSEQGFNGTRSRVNEERQPRSMIVFVCGKNKGFSRTCGKADCKSMMNWEDLTGNGKVWTG